MPINIGRDIGIKVSTCFNSRPGISAIRFNALLLHIIVTIQEGSLFPLWIRGIKDQTEFSACPKLPSYKGQSLDSKPEFIGPENKWWTVPHTSLPCLLQGHSSFSSLESGDGWTPEKELRCAKPVPLITLMSAWRTAVQVCRTFLRWHNSCGELRGLLCPLAF